MYTAKPCAGRSVSLIEGASFHGFVLLSLMENCATYNEECLVFENQLAYIQYSHKILLLRFLLLEENVYKTISNN